ncbi:hypothetical protein [Nocardia sp. CA-290969]|uniref:hypothetical protein n=1 Tax=Nocardia sp. CA-290969 TaxID=3239986 RepID=UPI003D8F7438
MPAQWDANDLAVVSSGLEEPMRIIGDTLDRLTEAVERVVHAEGALTDSDMGPAEVVAAWNAFRSAFTEELDVGIDALRSIAERIPAALIEFAVADKVAEGQVGGVQDE